MESAELAKKRAAFLVAFLWLATSLVYGLHPQAAVPLFEVAGFGGKSVSACAGVLAALLLCVFPLSRAALFGAFLVSALDCLAWHSWLGAYQPLVPAAFLFLLVFRRAGLPVARAALFQTAVLGLIAVTAHRLNAAYLSGAEFAPGAGTLSRDVPSFLRKGPAIAGSMEGWSLAWLASTAVPLAAFALNRRRAGWWLLIAFFFLMLPLYRVLFYGFYLAVPALFLVDPRFLAGWRGRFARYRYLPRPWFVYLGSLVAFIAWYLAAREELWPYLLAIALGLIAATGSTWSPEAKEPSTRGRASAFWGGTWLAYLALPFLFGFVPAPFALTQFSARETRHPPSETVVNWRGHAGCALLRQKYALRWGYRVWTDGDSCKLLVYRPLP